MPTDRPEARRPNAVPGTADALARGERPAPTSPDGRTPADPRVGAHDASPYHSGNPQPGAPHGPDSGDPAASDLSMRQPNERDESADPTATGPSVEGRRAANDVAAGREDTDRRSAGTGVREPGARAHPDERPSSGRSRS
jgi:hypothetical protein